MRRRLWFGLYAQRGEYCNDISVGVCAQFHFESIAVIEHAAGAADQSEIAQGPRQIAHSYVGLFELASAHKGRLSALTIGKS